MIKADYIVIALFVAGHCVGVLLWGFHFYAPSVLVMLVFTWLGVWYFSYRNPWWKKKKERDTEDGA